MTALSMHPSRPHPREGTALPPMPWRRMAWVTWRQQRAGLTAATAVLCLLAVLMLLAGLQLHHAYSAAVDCRPFSSGACFRLQDAFVGTNGFLANGFVLQVLPAVVGVFLGAPVLARELESGTFRYAWTQGFGRWRWTLAKLVGLGLALVAATGGVAALFWWYYQPYFTPASEIFPLSEPSPLAPGLFDLRGVAFPLWTLAAFSIGGLAGMLIRRVVPAIAASLALYAGLAFAAGGFLRAHYLAPVMTKSVTIPSTARILGQRWVTRTGGPATAAMLVRALVKAPGNLFGKGGVPKSAAVWQYLTDRGFTQWTTYQPASRFWAFQWIEGGWLLLLSALLIGATVVLVRRRAA